MSNMPTRGAGPAVAETKTRPMSGGTI